MNLTRLLWSKFVVEPLILLYIHEVELTLTGGSSYVAITINIFAQFKLWLCILLIVSYKSFVVISWCFAFEDSNLALGPWYRLPLSAHVCLCLVVEYWPFVDACGCHSHSKFYHCVILLLCFSLCHHPPHPCAPPTHPVIYIGQILMNSMKKSQKLVKISHYLLARLVVQKLIDN